MKYYLLFGFVMVAILIGFSGCADKQKETPITTTEFNIKVTSFEVYPPYVKEGEDYTLKFFVSNQGGKDVRLSDLDISVEAPCEIYSESLTIYPEEYYSGKDDSYYLPAGSTLVIKISGRLQANTPKGSCKGRLLYTYYDTLDVVKYVAVVNEKEVASVSDALKIKPAELKSELKQLDADVEVEEPVIVSSNNNEFLVVFILKNKGNGNILIDAKDVKIKKDENLVFGSSQEGCSFDTKESSVVLKPSETVHLTCKFDIAEIPSIREDYRISLEVPYRVRFAKDFEIRFKKENKGRESYYELSNLLTGKAISLNLDISKYLREGIQPEDVGKEMLKDVGKALFRHYLVDKTEFIMEDFSRGVDAYSRKYYGPRYGSKDGKIFAELRSESIAKRIFQGRCGQDPDLQEIEEECCEGITSFKKSGKCDEVSKYIRDEGCVERIIYVERDKINQKVIKPAIQQNADLIKKDLEEAVKKSIKQDRSKFKELYMPWVREHLREVYESGGVKGRRITIIGFDSIVEAVSEEIVTNVLVDAITNHELPIAISSFEEGYKQGFWQSYERVFAKKFPLDAYQACRNFR